MQVELKSLQREVGIAFVFVTHDQEEAMVMSDRIALLRSGELEQIASPREIYSRPATAYTAQFIGHTNLAASVKLKAEWRAARSLSWRQLCRMAGALFFASGKHSLAAMRHSARAWFTSGQHRASGFPRRH